MAEHGDKPTNPLKAEREAALGSWEKQANSSIIADGRKKKLSGVALAVLTLAALGAVWYVQNGSRSQTPSANRDLTIAERKPVPKLKEPSNQAAATVPPVTNAAAPATSPTPATVTQTSGPQEDPLEAQRREQERRMLEARLKSAIIPPNSANRAPQQDDAQKSIAAAGDRVAAAEQAARAPQDSNSRFARGVSGNGVPTSLASTIDHLDYKILQGKMVEAVLEPRAISDLPGMICATVQRDVYGSQGRVTLIPWGSRVCGVYSAELRKGQDRLFAVWNTLRRPDGVQVTLDSVGADQLGTAGMGGLVDTHFAEIFGVSALLSIIGAGAANVGVSSMDQQNSSSYYRQSVQQAAAQTSQTVLQPYVNMPPTITVPAATRIRIYVNRDLDFTSIYKADIELAKHDGVTFIN
ncbi:TrbI/VirB10 family protein [Variovorax sp. YR216]|uniref:TrbI/VirB10 family protein n=1 Tax=Variovorax sp. YR216 TaxID=1882828 RepID=UPI00089B9812|nr:TrbI/VirB10 family protein [Variovorax sp. YR216]SEB26323.1 type IV secretion system protein VirB10 [Variovorax sp. YR216]